MRTRTSVARRVIAALAASCVAVLLGVLLAPSAASAVPGREPGVAAPTAFWSVTDGAGALVGGATFSVLNKDTTRTIADCIQAPCAVGGDRDPDAGEFQVDVQESGNRTVRATLTAVPTGFTMPSPAPSQETTLSNNFSGHHQFATFVLQRNAPVTHPAAACTADVTYAVSATGIVQDVRASGVVELGRWQGVPGNVNALGISQDGRTIYAVQRGASANVPQQVLRYRTADGFQVLPGTAALGAGTIVAGAIAPDGRYYVGVVSTDSGTIAFGIHRYDPASSSFSSVGTIATGVAPVGLSNGDMAFDALGNLVMVSAAGTDIRTYAVPAAALAAGGTAALPWSMSGPHAVALEAVNGAAFAADGSLVVGVEGTAARFDPVTLSPIGNAFPIGSSTDLASCGTPPWLSLGKQVVSRVQAADQFRIRIGSGSAVHRSAETSGSGTTAAIPALTVRAGATYTLSEVMVASGSAVSTADYGIDLACTGATPSGSGATRTLTIPATTGTSGTQVACTFTNTSLVTTVVVRKDVQDAAGGSQQARAGWTVGAVATATSGAVTQSPAASGGASRQQTLASGAASWTVRHGSASAIASIAISEVQQPGYAFVSASCTVTTRTGTTSTVTLPSADGGSLTGIAAGSTVDCRFVNRELPTTLTLVNEAIPGAAATAWTLTATGPAGSLAGPSGTTDTVTARVTPGVAYALTDSGGPATYAAEGPWTCADGTGAAVAVTGASVTLARGAQVTCRIVHSTAQLVLLQHIEGAGDLQPGDFQLTATPAAGTPALATTTRTGTDAVGAASTIEVRPGRAYALASASDAVHIPLRLERHDGTRLPDGSLDPAHWTAAPDATATVPARGIAHYRFVALSPLPFVLPVTGGVGADAYQIGGLALLLLALGALALRALRRRRPTTPIHLRSIPASPQEGTATMATTSKSRSARIAAGIGAVAIAAIAAFGAAAPASAAPDNIDPNTPRSLTIHKFAEPETATGLSDDGTAIDEADLAGLTPLESVEFSIQRVGSIDLTTPEGWTAAEGLTPATATALDLGTPIVRETDEDGIARFTGLDAAVYLVTETDSGPNDIAFSADPFLVTLPMPADDAWVYDVHVYPKNAVTGIEKTFEDGLAAGLGERATWTLDADVPEIAAGETLTSFVISDTLDSRLSYVGATVTGTNVSLLPADYAVSVTGQVVTVTFSDLSTLAAANNASIQVEIVTDVTSLAGATTAEDGLISNAATLTIDGTVFDSNVVETEWATLAILAYEQRADVDDRTGVLAGAEFQIFASQADYDARTNPISVGGRSTFASNDSGVVLVGSLPAGQYWILETTAPAGYELQTDIDPVTLVGGEISATEIDRAVPHAQVPAYALPVTGGDGQLLFMLGGAGLVLLAVGFALVRRRKADQQA